VALPKIGHFSGSYTVLIGDPDTKGMKKLDGIQALGKGQELTIVVPFLEEQKRLQ
jgi:hypothetical protein